MKLFDLFLAGFKAYRKFRGGQWFKIGPSPANPSIGEFWIKGTPKIGERAYGREDYR